MGLQHDTTQHHDAARRLQSRSGWHQRPAAQHALHALMLLLLRACCSLFRAFVYVYLVSFSVQLVALTGLQVIWCVQ